MKINKRKWFNLKIKNNLKKINFNFVFKENIIVKYKRNNIKIVLNYFFEKYFVIKYFDNLLFC